MSSVDIEAKRTWFGHDFKVEIQVESEEVVPFVPIRGNVIIDTPMEIRHEGFRIQLEAELSIKPKPRQGHTLNCITENLMKSKYSPNIFSTFFCQPTDVSPVTINPGRSTCPFEISTTGKFDLPGTFARSFESLVYRLIFYMNKYDSKSVRVAHVDMVKFKGYVNMINKTSLCSEFPPILIEESFRELLHLRRLVKATFSAEKSGFIRGESVPFVLKVENRKGLWLKMSIQIIQICEYKEFWRSGKLYRNERMECFVVSKLTRETCQPELVWEDTLKIEENQEPSYTDDNNDTYGLSYILKIEIPDSEENIQGSAPIYIGTTRDSMEAE